MAVTAQELNIILTARDREFQAAMKRNQRRVERFAKQSQKNLSKTTVAFNKLDVAVRRLNPALLTLATFAGFSKLLKSTMETAKEIENLSRISGVGVEDFQVLAFAARDYGVQQEKLADILKDTNDKFGDFFQTGAGPLRDFFEKIAPKIGLTADAFRDLTSADALQLYVTSLQKAGASQQDMTFYMEALASDATILTDLFKDNGAALDVMRESAEELGIVLKEDMIDGAARMDETWSKVMASMKSNFMSFAAITLSGMDAIFSITDGEQMQDAVKVQEKALKNYQQLRTNLEGLDGNPRFQGGSEQAIAARHTMRTNLLGEVVGAKEILNSANDDLLVIQERMARLEKAKTLLSDLESGSGGGVPILGSGGGGGKSRISTIREDLEKLVETLDPASKAALDYSKAIETVNAALKEGLISQDEANSLIQTAQQRMQEAVSAADEFAGVWETVQSSMESAFMSMIDGTTSAKDAFRSMAKDIISELYRVLVVQQLVGSFEKGGNGFLGALYGGISPAGASVGVQATAQGLGNELHVPPRAAGVALAPQAQQSIGDGSVVVNQYFNLSANGDESVRKIIMQEAPKLVEASKNAVIQARRNGGAMRNAFG